jgi:hypothetical protein
MLLTCAIAALQTTSAGRIAAISDNLTGKRARMGCSVESGKRLRTISMLKVLGPSHLHN